MNNNKNKATTKEVLMPVEKTVELIDTPAIKDSTVDTTVIPKPKKKRYRKPKAKVVEETCSTVNCEIVYDPIVKVEVKSNWFKRQYSKFILWLNK